MRKDDIMSYLDGATGAMTMEEALDLYLLADDMAKVLTRRQNAVLELFLQNYKHDEIAERLNISTEKERGEWRAILKEFSRIPA